MKAVAVALAVLFLVLAVLAFMHPLEPSGLTKALGFSSDKVHTKHGILYIVLALLSLVWLRFQTADTARV